MPPPQDTKITSQEVATWLDNLARQPDQKKCLENPAISANMNRVVCSYLSNMVMKRSGVVNLADIRRLLQHGFYLTTEDQGRIWTRCQAQLKVKAVVELSRLLFAHGQLACVNAAEWGRHYICLYQSAGDQSQLLNPDALLVAFHATIQADCALADEIATSPLGRSIRDYASYAKDRLEVVATQQRPPALFDLIKRYIDQLTSKEEPLARSNQMLDVLVLLVDQYRKVKASSAAIDLAMWGGQFGKLFGQFSPDAWGDALGAVFHAMHRLVPSADWLQFWFDKKNPMTQPLFNFILTHFVGKDSFNQAMLFDGKTKHHMLIHLILSQNVTGVIWLLAYAQDKGIDLRSEGRYGFDIRAKESGGLERAVVDSGLGEDSEPRQLIYAALTKAFINEDELLGDEVGLVAPLQAVVASAPAKGSAERAPSTDSLSRPSKRAKKKGEFGWALTKEAKRTLSDGMSAGVHSASSTGPIYVPHGYSNSPRKKGSGSGGESASRQSVSVFDYDDAACSDEVLAAQRRLPRADSAPISHRGRDEAGLACSAGDRRGVASSGSRKRKQVGPAGVDEADLKVKTRPTVKRKQDEAELSSPGDGQHAHNAKKARPEKASEGGSVLVAESSPAFFAQPSASIKDPACSWALNPTCKLPDDPVVLFRGIHFHHGPFQSSLFDAPLSPAVRHLIEGGVSPAEAIQIVRGEFDKMSPDQASCFHQVYSNTYDKMLKELGDEKKFRAHFNAHFPGHPFVSSADLSTAIAYMLGDKFSGRQFKDPCLPQYDVKGRPKHPKVGLIQCCVVSASHAEHLRPCLVAYAQGRAFDHRIVAEGEVSSVAAFDGQVYAGEWLQCPSFDGPFTSVEDKCGLTEASYLHYQKRLCVAGSPEKTQAELDLLHALGDRVKETALRLADGIKNRQYFSLDSQPGLPQFSSEPIPLSVARILYHFNNASEVLADMSDAFYGQSEADRQQYLRRMITANHKGDHPAYGHMIRSIALLIQCQGKRELTYIQQLSGHKDFHRLRGAFQDERFSSACLALIAESVNCALHSLSPGDLEWLQGFLSLYPSEVDPVAKLSNKHRGILRKIVSWDCRYWFNPMGLDLDLSAIHSIAVELDESSYPRGRHPDAAPGALKPFGGGQVYQKVLGFDPWGLGADEASSEASSAGSAESDASLRPPFEFSSADGYQWFIRSIKLGHVGEVAAYLQWVTQRAQQSHPDDAEAAVQFASPYLVGEVVSKLSDAKKHPSPLLYASGYQGESLAIDVRDQMFDLLFTRILNTEFSSVSEDECGNRMTHWAVMSGSTWMLERIFKRHTNFMCTSNQAGETPLHLACELGYLPQVKLLVQHCVVVSLDAKGQTPLDRARCRSHAEVVAWLAPLHTCIEGLHQCFEASYNMLNNIKGYDTSVLVQSIANLRAHGEAYVALFRQYCESVRSNPPWSKNKPYLQKTIAYLAIEANDISLTGALIACGVRVNHRPQRYQGLSLYPAFIHAMQKGYDDLVKLMLVRQPIVMLARFPKSKAIDGFESFGVDIVGYVQQHPSAERRSVLMELVYSAYQANKVSIYAELDRLNKPRASDAKAVIEKAFASLNQASIGAALQAHGIMSPGQAGTDPPVGDPCLEENTTP